MRQMVKRSLFFSCVFLVLLPAAAFAQASLTGIVRDASGAVMPGVTVEASSPELIERVRSATTDGSGQYRIENLRPGTYAVTFTLTGFTTVKREGIELTGTFAATVNADLRVGAVEETVTVTGESPMVDVQNVKRQQTLTSEIIAAIPTARVYHSIMNLVPGVTTSGTQDVGGIAGPSVIVFAVHGGRLSEGRLQMDGLSVGAAVGGSGTSFYVVDIGNSQEVTFSTSGGMGEAETGGPLMNVVPRQGGNTNRGTFFANYANGSMQSSNYTDALKAAGLLAPNKLEKIWDVNASFGGALRKDRLWYYVGGRSQGNRKLVEGMYYNLNAGDPTKWTYERDLTRQATDDGTWKNVSLRLTSQLTPRNKVNLFWDEQDLCTSCIGGGTAVISPEAATQTIGRPQRAQQVTWSSPVTSRLLLEAGFGTVLIRYGGLEHDDNNRDLIRVVEQAGIIPNLTYRAQNWSRPWSGTYTWRASASYVTGAHSMKVGYWGTLYDAWTLNFTNNARLQYRFSNGVPNQLTMSGNPFLAINNTWPTAVYAQDQSTFGKLTLQGGVRFDYATSSFPAQQVGPEKFIPNPIALSAGTGTSFKDITPRMGVVYDVRGNGKTAIKVSLGRYLEASSAAGIYTATNPISRVVTSTTRAWTDSNRNFVADCDLLNPAAQNLTASGGDSCGAWSNLLFGQSSFDTNYDPAVTSGWGARAYNWDFGASVQNELLPRLSATVGYYRRIYGNFLVTDNLAVGPSDFTTFSVPVPQDSRLPNGGGYTVSGLYDVNPALFGRINNLVTFANNYGNQTEHWNGVDLNVDARLMNSLTLQGGFSTGRTVTDSCDIVAKVPEALNGMAAFGTANTSWMPATDCHLQTPFLTRYQGLGSYTVPKIDVRLSATFQSKPGAQLASNYNVPNAVAAASLGRSLSGGAANIPVNVVSPGTMYGDRINQIDFRAAKLLVFGRARTQFGIDLYNAFNSSAVQTYNQTLGTAYLTPTLVLPARFAKLSVQVDF
jgi:carboxypeptidase family protein